MPTKYKVKQGDCISSIAFSFGFLPSTIWDHPDNAELKNRSKDLNVLAPGDVLTVPDKSTKELDCGTDQRHTFIRKATPVGLRVQLLDEGQPVAAEPYRLDVDGRLLHGVTDGEGMIDEWIPNRAEKAFLYINDRLQFHLDLGYLDPVGQESGVRKRLQNLRLLYEGAGHGMYLDAVQRFREMHCGVPPLRRDQDSPEDDEFTAADRAVLVSLHGS